MASLASSIRRPSRAELCPTPCAGLPAGASASPCIVHAAINSWLNGWCTSRRFQRAAGRCCANPHCDGIDALEHYAICPHLRLCASRFLQIPSRPASLARFFGVDGDASAPPTLVAVHIYVARAVVHRHHLQAKTAADAADLLFLYRERLRQLACESPSLRRLLPRL